MKVQNSECRSMTCFAKCGSIRLLGVGLALTGIAMSLTLWLMPIGLPLALIGMGLVRPGEPCR